MAERKKSWREIDKQKDQSPHGSRRTFRFPTSGKKRAAKLGYTSYKKSLDKLFDQGVMTEGLKRTLGSKAGAAKTKTVPGSRMELLRKIQQVQSFDKYIKLVGQFRKKGYSYPDDYDFLTRLLDHPDEEVLIEVLEKLDTILQKIPCKRIKILDSKLNLLIDIGSLEVVEKAEKVLKKI